MDIQFNPISVKRHEVVSKAKEYLGIPYNRNTTFLERAANGEPYGVCNCYGFFLQVAKDLGLLSSDFDVNLPPGKNFNYPAAQTLWHLIRQNFTATTVEDMKPGDLILMAFKDVNPLWNEAHHVAMCVTAQGPYGGRGQALEMIHAFETRTAGGKVLIQTMDALTLSRVESVWRLDNLTGE